MLENEVGTDVHVPSQELSVTEGHMLIEFTGQQSILGGRFKRGWSSEATNRGYEQESCPVLFLIHYSDMVDVSKFHAGLQVVRREVLAPDSHTKD